MVALDTKFCKKFMKEHDMLPDKSKKLILNLFDKDNYIVEYRYLCYCLELGMVLERV